MFSKVYFEKILQQKGLGPSSSFTAFDVIKALEVISEEGSIGRVMLSKKLGLGEGMTRTLISRLLGARLIKSSRIGCSLSKNGEKLWKHLKSIFPRKMMIEENELTFAAYNVAVLVKNKACVVKKGLEQRDAAVKAGALGAITLVKKNGKIALPTISLDISSDYPKAFNQIQQLMNPLENDVIIIGCASTLKDAEYGALAAAWTLL
ncbi:MAG: DUF4443 domain-containing protein [Candidatus Bathyarchaeia archaeon]